MGGVCLSDKKMREDTDWAIQAMHIKTPSQKTQIRSLSGGNQQKVIIGRWLLTKPEILLLDEPTRGIDVARNMKSISLIIDLANEGKGVIVVSSRRCRSCWAFATAFWSCPAAVWPARWTPRIPARRRSSPLAAKYV